MPAPPLVSVVVPAYVRTAEQLHLLQETLSTVAAQTCADHEVIVVDDGSPRAVASQLAGDSRCTVVRQQNAGVAVARNSGIAASSGQHLVFLDADDHLLPTALDTALSHLVAHPDCSFVIGPREEMTYEGQPVSWQVAPPPSAGDPWNLYLALLRFDWYIIPPSAAMFRREAVLGIGGFQDPWGADDLDFYLRMARTYRAWCYQSPAVTRYRRYSASSSRDGERMLRSVRAVYAREWPHVRGSKEAEHAFDSGLRRLTEIFTDCLVENLQDRARAANWRGAVRSAVTLARERPHKLLAALAGAARGVVGPVPG